MEERALGLHITEWRRGWRVALGSAVGVGTGAGLYQYVSSLFVPALELAYGWSRSEVTGAMAIGLLGALAAPLIGALADKIGILRVISMSIALVVLCHLGLALMSGEIWQFIVLFFFLSLSAPGCTSLVYSRAIAGWFDHSRGFALGVMASGLSLSGLLFSPFLGFILTEFGPGTAYLFLAVLAGLVGLPIVLLFVREENPNASPVSKLGDLPDDSIWVAMRSRYFWLLASVMICINVPAGGVLSQLSPLLVSKGISIGFATMLVSVFAGSVLVGRLGIGWLFDRFEAAKVASLVTIASALGCVAIIFGHPVVIIIAVVLVGLMQGSETDVLAYFISRLFGLQAYNAIYGALFAISLLATAAGIAGFGLIFDATGNYNAALLLAAAMLCTCSALYFAFPSMRARRET